MAERSPEHGTADGKPAVKYARLSDPLSGGVDRRTLLGAFSSGQPAPDVFDYEELHLAGDGTAGSGGQAWLRRSDLYVFSGKAAGGWRTSMVRRNDDPGFTYDAYLL